MTIRHFGGEQRVHLWLWHLSDRFGFVTPGGRVIHAPLTPGLLGEMLATSRQTVWTSIKHLEEQGLISQSSGVICLHGRCPVHRPAPPA